MTTAGIVTAAAVIAAVVVVTAATTAVNRLQLFGSGIAHNDDFAFEAHVFACKGVVEVHFYMGVCNLLDNSVYTVAVCCHHGQYCSGGDCFVVEFAVNFEYIFFKSDNLFGVK